MIMPSRHQIFLLFLFGYVNGLSAFFTGGWSQPKNNGEAKIAATDTFYVSPQGSNSTGTGTKTQPWRSITFALSKLQSDSLKPKVIKVANGVYSAAAAGETFPINLKSWISVIGSDSLETIIDANRNARAIVGQNAANVLIDRLMIRNGFARADTGEASRGGGLLLRNCRQVVLRSCVVRDNEAKTSGGGVFLGGGSEIRLENNYLDNNRAFDGAGVYCSRTKSIRIGANIIQYNTAKNSAGGIFIDSASPTVQRNRIRWNNASTIVAKNAGGILVQSGDPLIGGAWDMGNDIHDNVGGSSGSQLYVINNTTPLNARYNFWGAVPNSSLVAPASLIDFTNYRNLAINIPLGTTDFYVAPNGSDRNNGTKKAPWRTIHYAVTQIFATDIDSLTINLAPGTYSAPTTGELFPVYMKSNLTLLGSSSGQSLQSKSPATTSPATIISGEGGSSHELLRLENVSSVRLANMIFRNAKVGAVLGRNSDGIIIENCVFEDNQSARGAAITFAKVKSSEIRNNLFRRNRSAGSGGALVLAQDGSTISGNLFAENSANTGGGAVHCDSTSDTRFLRNEFQKNTAGFGGALYFTRSNPRLLNNRILSNHATASGGGAIALDGASMPLIGTRDNQSNDIYLNTAVKGGSQIQRLDPGLKVDVRSNYWGQIPDSTMLAPFAQFATDNYRQVSERMPASTREIYVSPTGDDAQSGGSRSEALRTIKQAQQLAFGTEKSPVTLHLLQGRFAVSTNGEAFPITLKNFLVLRGASRDSTSVDAENRSRVFEGNNVVGSTVVNMKIVGGTASGYGGAVLVSNGMTASAHKTVSLTIENCTLQENSATHGGALAAIRNYKTIIRGCIFSNNTSRQNGGAVLALGDSVEISGSEFYSNLAKAGGGAVNIDSAAVLTLANSWIHDNTAAQGGGVAVTNGWARIWRNVIIDNVAQGGPGGGIYLSTSGKAIIGGAAENGNDLYGNRAVNSGNAVGSALRNDKIEARHNFWGGRPEATLVNHPANFEVTPYRYVTISVPEKSREFYFSPKGNDGNSGVSRNSPWCNLNVALRKFFSEPGDSVRLNLLNGTYSPNTTGERFPLRLPSRVSLIGQHPDSVLLDGGSKTRILEIYDATRVWIRNLTLINGNGTSITMPQAISAYSAGGARIHKSSVIHFEQVAFLKNRTDSDGGAIAADSSDSVVMLNCRFSDNAGRGGGVFFHRTSGEIRGCNFRLNRSPNNGSAIYLDSASPKIVSNLIIGNISESTDIGGAIFCAGSSLPVIGGAPGQGNDIYNNTGGIRGRFLARHSNSPVIPATFNYLGDGSLDEKIIYPVIGFDVSFTRSTPITKNGVPVITLIAPPNNQPVKISRLDTITFQIVAYDPDNELLTYTWTLDEGAIPVGFGAQYAFYPYFIDPGNHRLRVIVSDQRDTISVSWNVEVVTTSVDARSENLPVTFSLDQNFPNPLRSSEALTVIPYQLARRSEVILEVYDLLGRNVRLLEQSQKPAGFYTTKWDGRDQRGNSVESGIYFIQMRAGDFTAQRKILVIR
ncbi:MAG: DUF1565 domain-containing protein [candidate division KSB1 bacterium]|nr:DUF1565 domain-containing protein [candidate division KSB1 bacterium]MDZ7301688.1 DUF1565 domain-containing protein [candidate division KSB1 bacterium]MDZ7312425.1 DUF1565 domain-containing protein [candidate division KSB1 bacterium]